jgi:sulfur carrier protein ThiS adenylyltransferase
VQQLGEETIKKIQNTRVGIAGAGGLGSNCAYNLVRTGFKKLKIVDFDRVVYSNLNRQFYFADQVGMVKVEALQVNLKRINADIELEIVCEKIDESNVDTIFRDCDVVVEAFDRVEYKKLLIEAYASSGKLVVAGSGMAGWGNSDKIATRKVNEKFYIAGDMVSEVSDKMPPLSPKVNITAAKQADIILGLVINSII